MGRLVGPEHREIAASLCGEGGVPAGMLNHFHTLYADPTYWTAAIAFTVTLAGARRRRNQPPKDEPKQDCQIHGCDPESIR